MSEIRAELKNIRAVEIKSKVFNVKDDKPKVVTAVRFEYDGEPSEMENILMLEAQNRPVNADIYSPQAAFAFDERPVGVGDLGDYPLKTPPAEPKAGVKSL